MTKVATNKSLSAEDWFLENNLILQLDKISSKKFDDTIYIDNLGEVFYQHEIDVKYMPVYDPSIDGFRQGIDIKTFDGRDLTKFEGDFYALEINQIKDNKLVLLFGQTHIILDVILTTLFNHTFHINLEDGVYYEKDPEEPLLGKQRRINETLVKPVFPESHNLFFRDLIYWQVKNNGTFTHGLKKEHNKLYQEIRNVE